MNLFNAIILALLSFCDFSESVLAGNTDTVKTIQKSVSLKHLSNNVIKKFYGHWLSDDYQAKFYLTDVTKYTPQDV